MAYFSLISTFFHYITNIQDEGRDENQGNQYRDKKCIDRMELIGIILRTSEMIEKYLRRMSSESQAYDRGTQIYTRRILYNICHILYDRQIDEELNAEKLTSIIGSTTRI